MKFFTDKGGRSHEFNVILNPSGLPAEDKTALVDMLTPVTGRGFMRQEVTDGLREDVANHVLGASRLGIALSDDAITAFVAADVIPTPDGNLYHLGGLIVEPEYHTAGLAKQILQSEMADTNSQYLGFHTQNRKMANLGECVAPRQPGLLERFGALLHSGNPQGNVDVGRYGGQSLYGDTEQFAPKAVSGIDWMHGDALIFIGGKT